MIEIIECCDEAVTPENLCDRLRKERLKRDWSQMTAAIEAMSDLIKRSDAIKAVWGDDINPSEDGMVFEAQSHIDRDIRLIPPADRPSGKWIVDEEQGTSTCSNCGIVWQFTDGTKGSNFCPNCGCRMKGADDE